MMTATVTTVSLLVIISVNILGCQASNQTGWTCVNNYCYLVVYTPLSWYEAVTDCINKGGDLLSITNQQEQRLIEGLIKNTPDHYWIGASDFQGNWSWIDKSAFNFTKWAIGEPNNALGKEHCAGIWPLRSDGWNDFICDLKTNYICKRGVDPCSNHTCYNGGTCYVVPNTCSPVHACHCATGYDERSDCKIEINECLSSPCQHGTCVDALNHYHCVCDPGYTGVNCEKDIDECAVSGCLNGTCIDKVNGFICHCYPGFSGTLCEIDINECFSNPCIHGNCIDRVNGFFCSCSSGYTGEHCNQENTKQNGVLPTSCVKHTGSRTAYTKNDEMRLLIPISVSMGIVILILLIIIQYLLIKYKGCTTADNNKQKKRCSNHAKKIQVEPSRSASPRRGLEF